MLKKILAAMAAALVVGSAIPCTTCAMSEIEMLDRLGYNSVVNVSAIDTDIDLSDTDPTHNANYIKYVEDLKEYGYNPIPELVEQFRNKYTFEEPDINVYSKESGNPRCTYEVEYLHKPFLTKITITETNIDMDSVENNIRNIINSENAEVSTYTNTNNTFFSITFNEFSPEESYELSVKIADMLSENYTIESAVENFSYRTFDDFTVEYDRFVKMENSTFMMMSNLSAEELESFNTKLSENDVKAHFETSTESESYGLAIYDEGLTSAEIRENAEKIQEITGFSPETVYTDDIPLRYGLCLNFSAKYKVSDDTKEHMKVEQTAIPVVLIYENMSLYNIDKTYTSKVNEYKKFMSSQSKYTDEEKQKLIEDFKTKTWMELVTAEREKYVKRTIKNLGLSIDEVSYTIGDSKISCYLSTEQINEAASSFDVKSIRMIRKGENFDMENHEYYENFSPVEGDANGDKNLSISDAVCILQYMANSEKYPISSYLSVNADISGFDGITAKDAATIQYLDANTIS